LLEIDPSGGSDFPDLWNITLGINTWVARSKAASPHYL
jgi:hypothetical protein